MKKLLIVVPIVALLLVAVSQATGSSVQRAMLDTYWKFQSADTLVNGPQFYSQKHWAKSTVSVATPKNWYQFALKSSATKVSRSGHCNASVGIGQVSVYEHKSLAQVQQDWKQAMLTTDTFSTIKSNDNEVQLQVHSRNVTDSVTVLVFKRIGGQTVGTDVGGTLNCSEPQNKPKAMQGLQQTLQTMANGIAFNVQPS